MSADLLFECIRKNNAFLRASSSSGYKTILSAEAGNLTAKNSSKFSGILPGKAAGLGLVSKGKNQQIILTTSASGANLNRPKKAFVSTTISKNFKSGQNAISKVLGASRAGLVAQAKAKLVKVKQALRKRN